MNKIKAFLAIFAAAGAIFKFAPLLSFLGPVGSLVGAAGGLIAKLVVWFFRGVTVVLANPVVFVGVVPIGLGTYALGINRGLLIDKHRVETARQERDEWKGAHAKLMKDAKVANDGDKTKFEAALKAKAAAEAAESAKASPPAAPAAAPAATSSSIEDKAMGVVMTTLTEKGGSATKQQLAQAAFAQLKDDSDRNAVLAVVATDAFLGAEGRPWGYDGSTASFAA